VLGHLGWPQAWRHATAVRYSCAGPLICHCAAVVKNFNLSHSERLTEAVRRGRGLWCVRSWQVGCSWVTVQDVLRKDSRAAGSERERGFTLETAQREFTVL